MKSVTVRAPINIAIVKYWGKVNEEDVIPTNPSISVTLDMEEIWTETTIERTYTDGVEFILNGEPAKISTRMNKVIKEFFHSNMGIRIVSQNSFPTAAGLASSASGMAALTRALRSFTAQNEELLDGQYLSKVARMGSGSASRSIFGGFVKWDGESARQLFPHQHWPELCCLVVILQEDKKELSSTKAMQRTIATSQLYKRRLEIIHERIAELEDAICNREFDIFAVVCMKESNQLHALCLDSFPPISYLTEKSWAIIRAVHELNDHDNTNSSENVKHYIAAYTFDAGSNAFVFCLKKDVVTVRQCLERCVDDARIIRCRVGEGPRLL